MRVDIYFDSYGPSFYCCECNVRLKNDKNHLTHPIAKGFVWKTPTHCAYAGKSFIHPFLGVNLEATQ
jgi:hypothetical protein